MSPRNLPRHISKLLSTGAMLLLCGTVLAQDPTPSAASETREADVKRSQWKGYERLDFKVDGRASILVIPQNPLPGKPWIWRTEFFGAFPSVDIDLLSKGVYVAYTNMENQYGGPVAMEHMDVFYNYVTGEYTLSPKVILEGFSRGGLFAFNWAARHPENVASLYVDAPVCDFKSWPGGKGKGRGAPADWERCKKVYGLSEKEALIYQANPVDQLAVLASAGIPIIAVAGDTDEIVPMEENIALVDKRYRALGGKVQLIVKPGVGHHPHSLEDPTPVTSFLLDHIQ